MRNYKMANQPKTGEQNMVTSDRLPRSDIDQKHKPDRCQHCGQPWKGLTPVKTIVGAIKLLMKDQPPLWWWSDDDLERMAADLTPGAQLLNLYAFSARFQLATGEIIEIVRRDPI